MHEHDDEEDEYEHERNKARPLLADCSDPKD